MTPDVSAARRAAFVVLLGLVAAARAEQRVIRATGMVLPDGGIQTDARILLDGERIRQVGGEMPGDAVTDDYATAVISPGLIDLHAAVGAFGQLHESQSAVQPGARAADALDPYNRQFHGALLAGVTTLALLPDERNLIGGQGALVRAAGEAGQPTLWSQPGPLRLSLSPAVFRPDREPTSRSGALGMLRDALLRAAQDGGASSAPLGQFARGSLPGIISAPSGADVFAAIALVDELKLRLTFVHQDDARSVAGELARIGSGVVVGPYDFATAPRQTAAAGVFERAKVRVAIAGNLPHAAPDSLRVGAAVAARDGLSPEAARRAITAVPAELLGLGEQIGSLSPGRLADLVVFSGDPLDLRSRVLAVYVGGRRVHHAPEP